LNQNVIPTYNVAPSFMELGRVKTLGGRRSELAEVSDARRFRGFGYARIAAKSGRMPMMFMTRVRL